MRGLHRHSPSTGHDLSREKEFPGTIGKPARTDEAGHGELTNGELTSSRKALLRRFRDRAKAHRESVEPELVRKAALGLQKLKRDDVMDWAAWFALAEWLGHPESDWMQFEAPIRDPVSGRELHTQPSVSGPQYVDRTDGRSDKTGDVRDHVREVFERSFDESLEELTVL